LLLLPPPTSTLFPYTTLFRSHRREEGVVRVLDDHRASPSLDLDRSRGSVVVSAGEHDADHPTPKMLGRRTEQRVNGGPGAVLPRSEEHTSELQSLRHLVCRLL